MNISETIMDNEVTINVTGGTAPFGYVWSNTATGQTNTLTESGTYTVTVTDAEGCEETHSFNFTITSSENALEDQRLDIFPNPARQHLVFALSEASTTPLSIQIHNLQGQRLLQADWASGEQFSLDISALPAGMYTISVQAGAYTMTKKILVMK
jgi:hypothetical protein